MQKEEELIRIFNENCKSVMINWDIHSFRRTHPTLLKAIIEAMKEVDNQ